VGRITQPDVFVVPPTDGRRPPRWRDVRHLLVAAEVLSPSTARHDRVTKRHYYQGQGVPEYWIADVDARIVERWHPGDERPELVESTLVWHPAGVDEPFTLDLPRYFAEVHDERA
jgi:Uma2 family endonuclease